MSKTTDSIIEKVTGFNSWVLENYRKYHSPETRANRRLAEFDQHDCKGEKCVTCAEHGYAI